jgi:Cys-tRNA(Pro)/Cys-tRNA(Cys) deacylase
MNEFHKLHKNVQAAISEFGSTYTVHDHRKFSSEIRSPYDFAAVLGYPIQRVTKTLFLRGHGAQSHAMVVCSMDRRLDFASAASAVGVKRVEVAPEGDLEVITGYPRNGVSPLGLAEDIPVIVDEPLLDYPTVLVGGGATAVEIELTPADLIRISGATVKRITTLADSTWGRAGSKLDNNYWLLQ